MRIFIIPVQIIASILPVIAIVLSLIVNVVSLASLALDIVGMIKAAERKLLRYPVNFRLIRQRRGSRRGPRLLPPGTGGRGITVARIAPGSITLRARKCAAFIIRL